MNGGSALQPANLSALGLWQPEGSLGRLLVLSGDASMRTGPATGLRPSPLPRPWYNSHSVQSPIMAGARVSINRRGLT
ncbi:unnamed protein product [Protopolystoma xenopodis]|uniref:Uncharacterized protein n=1 Tax=Protopolystoma xenopodis TaxID=117903 RepID=A0A448WQL1_9PLAT|nr:unnamed protein product [Protopolystoma xenopodis]